MDAKEIVTKVFEKSKFGGYKIEDVDKYLRDLSVEFKTLQNENEETEKKLEVLADRIKQYRADEDALRDALLIAKKNAIQIENDAKNTAEQILTEAKENAERTEAEARTKAEKTIRDADTLAANRREMSEQALARAKAEAEKLISDAKAESERIHLEMTQRTEREQIILARVKQESDEYLRKILAAYNAHIEYIKSIPEQCENEFVIDTSRVISQMAPEESAFYVKPEPVVPPVYEEVFTPVTQEEPVVEEAPAPAPAPEEQPAEESVVTEEAYAKAVTEEPVMQEAPVVEEAPVTEEKSEPVLTTPTADVKHNSKTDSVLFSLGTKTKDGHRSDLEFGKNIKGRK